MKTAKSAMSHAQQRFLFERLTAIKRDKPGRYEAIPSIKEPAQVAHARKSIRALQRIIDKWDKKISAMKEKRQQRIAAAESNCRTLIYFGSPQDAMKELDKFEATKF